MASLARACRSTWCIGCHHSQRMKCHGPRATMAITSCRGPLAAAARPLALSFHASRMPRKEETTRTDFSSLDVLANTPIPSTSVDVCTSAGFHLNSGARIADGSGALLVGGEAFVWRPWLAYENDPQRKMRLLNTKGQWDVEAYTLDLLAMLWPRPDLLVLGLGPENRLISPELQKAISALGMRVAALDTRNAAAQYNMLATERGIHDVAAALIPLGWREGEGAGWAVDQDTPIAHA